MNNKKKKLLEILSIKSISIIEKKETVIYFENHRLEEKLGTLN